MLFLAGQRRAVCDSQRKTRRKVDGRSVERDECIPSAKQRFGRAIQPDVAAATVETCRIRARSRTAPVSEKQTDWDLFLDSILFSYRVSRQDSTHESPFFLVYGRQARQSTRHGQWLCNEKDCRWRWPCHRVSVNYNFFIRSQNLVAFERRQNWLKKGYFPTFPNI